MKDWGKIHDDLAAFMKRPSRRKLILLPRGHLKSSIVTKGWSIQQALNKPNIRILIANAVWDNSRKFLRSIQGYLANGNTLCQIFGQFESAHWNQEECTIRQRTEILDAPTWATTGLEKEQTSQHYDLIFCDDLVAKENVNTPEMREKVKDYYAMLYALLEPGGQMIVIGTRYHQADLYASILEDKTFDVFDMHKECWDAVTKVPIFPEKFSTEALDDMRKAMGNYIFSAQMLNNPVDPASADFKRAWIHYYDPTTPHPATLYLAVDPASSLSKDADFSGFTISGMFANRKIRIVDCVRKKCVPSEVVDTIFELVEKWKKQGHYVRVGIEAFGYQKTLKTDVYNQMKERKLFFPIDEIKKMRGPNGEKSDVKNARIRALQPLFEQGLIEIRADMDDFVEELLSFPRGRHDDLIDSFSMALDFLVPSQHRIKPKSVEYGSVDWWLKNHMKQPQQSIYERFMADLKTK